MSSGDGPGKGLYTVREGDHDWTIAKKFDTTPDRLRALNPGLNWRRIQIGQKLTVPGGSTKVALAKTESKPAPKASGSYAVRDGENDWLIARRFDTTPKVIRQLNPEINWNRLQIGSKIRVPGASTATVAKSTEAPKLKSRYAVVTGEGVTIRRGPSTGADSITTVDAGTRVTVLDRDGSWYRLRFPKGTEGWMRADFLKAAKSPSVVAKSSSSKPGKRMSKPARYASKDIDHEVGYITDEVVAMQQKGGTVDKILNKARSMRGTRYRWGQASRSGTDCSGYTTQVFKSIGTKLPRTSSEQSRVGSKVSRSSLKAGDLVFFRTTRGSRVSHVGIYMGSGKFMHASSGGGKVMESSLSDPYYNNRYVTARRLVKSKKSPKELVQELPNLPNLPSIDSASEAEKTVAAPPVDPGPVKN